jgi:hypothetical protein
MALALILNDPAPSGGQPHTPFFALREKDKGMRGWPTRRRHIRSDEGTKRRTRPARPIQSGVIGGGEILDGRD